MVLIFYFIIVSQKSFVNEPTSNRQSGYMDEVGLKPAIFKLEDFSIYTPEYFTC